MSKKNSEAVSKPSIWPKFITFAFILIVIVVSVSLLPRGFSQDVSLVGQGANVVILVHDNNVIQSADTMIAMNEVRDEYDGRVEFVVADIMTPDGRTFADRHNLQPTALVFFSGNGIRLDTIYTEQTGESLRNTLNVTYGYR